MFLCFLWLFPLKKKISLSFNSYAWILRVHMQNDGWIKKRRDDQRPSLWASLFLDTQDWRRHAELTIPNLPRVCVKEGEIRSNQIDKSDFDPVCLFIRTVNHTLAGWKRIECLYKKISTYTSHKPSLYPGFLNAFFKSPGTLEKTLVIERVSRLSPN